MKLAEEYGREAGELEAVISDLESELELLNQNAEEALTLSRQAEREYQSHRSETARYAQWISSEEEKAADHRKKIFQAQREAEMARKEYESEISQYTGAGRMDERVVIDEALWKNCFPRISEHPLMPRWQIPGLPSDTTGSGKNCLGMRCA